MHVHVAGQLAVMQPCASRTTHHGGKRLVNIPLAPPMLCACCVQAARAVDLAVVYRWLSNGRPMEQPTFNLPDNRYLEVRFACCVAPAVVGPCCRDICHLSVP